MVKVFLITDENINEQEHIHFKNLWKDYKIFKKNTDNFRLTDDNYSRCVVDVK